MSNDEKIRKLVRELKYGSPAPKFVLVKYPGKNILIEVFSGYASEEEIKIIINAGWSTDNVQTPKYPAHELKHHPWLVTEIFYPPFGSGLFGLHTRKEEKIYRHSIEKTFQRANIPLYYRKGNLHELL